MGRVTAEVRALLQERQDRHKAELDAHSLQRETKCCSIRNISCPPGPRRG